MIGYVYCAIATVAVITGDYFIKTAADRTLSMFSWQFLLGGGLYALSATGWYLSMRSISLAQVGVAFSAFTLLALCAMGVLLFDEKLYAREYMGIGAAVLSLFLMARFV